MKLAQIRRLYPKKLQREFETEILGIAEEGSEAYINGELLDALKEKPRFELDADDAYTFPEIFVGIDPLSHGRSEMGICALAYSKRGEKVVLGTAAVPTVRPMLVEVKTAIRVFLQRLREHPGCALSILIPIVEWCVHTGPDPSGPAPGPAPPPAPNSHRARPVRSRIRSRIRSRQQQQRGLQLRAHKDL